MINYIKEYFKELKLINYYYAYSKEKTDKYPTYHKDYYYHITPIDLGQKTIIQNLVCKTGSISFLDETKDCFLDIPQLCVSKTVFDCIMSLYYEKFNTENFYAYRTVNKEIAYSHIFLETELIVRESTMRKKL